MKGNETVEELTNSCASCRKHGLECCAVLPWLWIGTTGLLSLWPSWWSAGLTQCVLADGLEMGWAGEANFNQATPTETNFPLKCVKGITFSIWPMKTSHLYWNPPCPCLNRSSSGSRTWRNFTWTCSGCAAIWPACKAGSCLTLRVSWRLPAAPPSWPLAGWASCQSPLSTLWYVPEDGRFCGAQGGLRRLTFLRLVVILLCWDLPQRCPGARHGGSTLGSQLLCCLFEEPNCWWTVTKYSGLHLPFCLIHLMYSGRWNPRGVAIVVWRSKGPIEGFFFLSVLQRALLGFLNLALCGQYYSSVWGFAGCFADLVTHPGEIRRLWLGLCYPDKEKSIWWMHFWYVRHAVAFGAGRRAHTAIRAYWR